MLSRALALEPHYSFLMRLILINNTHFFLKKSLFVLTLVGAIHSTAFSMDFSGIDIKTIRIGTGAPGEMNTNAISDARFRRDCPARFGAKYEFTGYTAEQKPRTMTSFEIIYLTALRNQMIEYYNRNPLNPDLEARMTAYNRIVADLTLTETTYAMCTSFGPSTKPKRQHEWDQFRVNIEMFLLRHGYYNIKLKVLGFLGL
jgi:hypothetical protein